MNNVKYVVVTMIAVVFTWTFHEFAHWLAGELLGNDMIMSMNTCYPKGGHYVEAWHSTVVSAAGPVVTLIQAFVLYFLLKAKPNQLLFPFLLTCLYMRFLAGIMNFINPNDEGRISMELGLGKFTLSILVVAVLFYLVYNISKARGYRARLIWATIALIMLFSSILILTDQAFRVTVIG